MLQTSWINSLTRSLPRKQDNRLSLPRTCLIGIGSDLRGDDSAGLVVIRQMLQHSYADNLCLIEGGPAPENVTGQIRAFHPDLVILVDAAHMDMPPGTIQWIPLESIDGMSASSHSLPLSMLASYLTAEIGCEVTVLGIQPVQNEIGFGLSSFVKSAVDEIVIELGKIFSIHSLDD